MLMSGPKLLLCASLTFVAVGAGAQDRPRDYAAVLKSDCAAELANHCKDVADGEGRLLACLYSREDRLSERCASTVMMSLERLGVALGALANVTRACHDDALRLCQGKIAGNGNLVGCLSNSRAMVSTQCNATLDAAFLNAIGDR
jgi:hypothetical protein